MSIETRIRPDGWHAIALKDGQSVVYYGQNRKGQPAAIGYRGRARRPAFHYRFSSAGHRAEYVGEFVASVMDALRRKEERAAQKAAALDAGHGLQVGDVMCSSWGYDQTNIDFYQVVRTSRACVWVRPIARQSSGLGGMTGECVPLPDKFTGPEFRALVDPLHKNIKVGSRQYASLLSPKIVAGVKIYAPQTWTAYA